MSVQDGTAGFRLFLRINGWCALGSQSYAVPRGAGNHAYYATHHLDSQLLGHEIEQSGRRKGFGGMLRRSADLLAPDAPHHTPIRHALRKDAGL